MNFIQRQMARLAFKGVDLSLLDPKGWQFIGGGSTWAKMTVLPDTQFQITAAWSAIRLISETIGAMPLHLYKKTGDGRERASSHPLCELIEGQPNGYMTACNFKEAIAVSLVTEGQSYSLTTRVPGSGRVVSIEPLHRSRIKPEIKGTGEIVYGFTDRQGARRELSAVDACPIRGFGNAGELEGFAPHRLHANSMALTLAIEKYGSDFFGSGGRPSGFLSTEGEFKAEQRDAIRENFNKYTRESWASGSLPILERNLKYTAVTQPNNEAQFLETRKHQIAEVARIYRVPPHMLMEMDRATDNNSEQAGKAFLDKTLLPYLVRIEEGLNANLLTAQERSKEQLYFKFDVRGLLRGDSAQRSKYYLDMRMAGAMTQNEVRTLEDMIKIDGADDLHVPLNMAPSDMLRQIEKV